MEYEAAAFGPTYVPYPAPRMTMQPPRFVENFIKRMTMNFNEKFIENSCSSQNFLTKLR